MERKTVLWIIIGALFLAVLFIAFMAGAGVSADALTNTANAAAGSSAMVGGC